MPFLKRNEIGWNERFRRCIYFFLRDELDCLLISEGLIESYRAFRAAGKEYPFVEPKLLKPRSRIVGPEYNEHRHFIVIFNEDVLPSKAKTHIRFFESNKLTKENITNLAVFDVQHVYQQRMRFFEDSEFPTLLRNLLPADYAVMIQRDPTIKARYRFGISHFHVKIDWPVAHAAEDLGKWLRYISRDLYEKGDKAGEHLQNKLYEYYGFHYTVGGRRTAALVAARYMAGFDFISTVYVASSEARTLVRLSEKGLSKYILIKVSNQEVKELAQIAGIDEDEFEEAYLIDRQPDYGVGIFLVTYSHNEHSIPPPDGKLRDLNPDFPWLRVDLQLLVPPPTSRDARPIPRSRVYV